MGKWAEYDSAAEWCARRGLTGKNGDPLPQGLSAEVFEEICNHPEEFMERVRAMAYMTARMRYNLSEDA